jgi:hypothetical protein
MGGGIVSMHYIGMSALHDSAHLMHAPAYVALSAIIAIAASGLALWLAGGGDGRPPLLLSATALGVAIAGMHYTAMAGLTMEPRHVQTIGAPALSSDLLAIVVAIVAFLVSGFFLLALVPDRAGTRAAPVAHGSTQQDRGHDESPLNRAGPVGAALVSVEPLITVDSAVGRSEAPLGSGEPQPARQLPVERDGTIHYVAVDSIVAVHANAHYAYIFDGSSKLFCPLAIGQIEARLDEARFVRVHRSHIVNIERVAGLRRAGDNGILELAARERYTVPVSRSRLRRLKNRLGQRIGEPAA